MQKVLTLQAVWARICGLDINPSKTALVLYYRAHNDPAFERLTLNSVEIQVSEKGKYLKVVIDRKVLPKRNF